MQAQRYGTLPIAHRTGGLADTIEDGETGFLFSELSGEGLFGACRRAFEAFDDPGVLGEMRQAAMARSFHWSGAAAEYEQLYARLIGRRLSQIVPGPPRRRTRPAPAELQAAA
jgi:starch synthase